MTVTAPCAWRVCGNGSVTRTEARGDARAWHFKTTPPLPPYLIAVVAGKYHTVERKHRDIPMALWCRESLAKWIDEQAEEIFEITAAGLDFFESYFGLSYPFDEYNQLFVPEFNMGAMENPGCVTFNEAYIHRGQASEAQLQRRAETILHEMAHVHGFGDVTTMRWWGDLWLNETFATYMANLAHGEVNSLHQRVGRLRQQRQGHRRASGPTGDDPSDRRSRSRHRVGSSELRRHHVPQGCGGDAPVGGPGSATTRSNGACRTISSATGGERRSPGVPRLPPPRIRPRPHQLGAGLAPDHRDQHLPGPPRRNRTAATHPSRSNSPPSLSIRLCALTARASASMTAATPTGCCVCASASRPTSRARSPRSASWWVNGSATSSSSTMAT